MHQSPGRGIQLAENGERDRKKVDAHGKCAVVEFMSGDRATAIVRKSSKHLDLLRTFAQDCHEGAMTITY